MNVQHALSSALAGAEPGTAKMDKLTPLDSYIRKIFKDEFASLKKAKLTWSPGAPPPSGDDQTIGLLNKRLAFMGPFGGRFYIQNNMILMSNGVPCTLEEVPDSPYVWTDKHGQRHEAPSDRKAVGEALVRFRADALARDPLLCPVCAIERCADMNDRMKHIYNAHPVEFAEFVGLPEAELSNIPLTEPVTVVEPESEPIPLSHIPPQDRPRRGRPPKPQPRG